LLLEFLYLVYIGFIVGLSGAIMPGPLLAFTVFDTTRKSKITGHYIIMGHAIWESLLITFILFGLGSILQLNRTIIYLVGGLVLVWMGLGITRKKTDKVEMEKPKVNSSIGGGIFYTVFNPAMPIWWATAGLALLLKGSEVMGLLGVFFIMIGHWLSDFAYYIFVSFVVHRNKKYVNPKQRQIALLLGLFVAAIGSYFVIQALSQLFSWP